MAVVVAGGLQAPGPGLAPGLADIARGRDPCSPGDRRLRPRALDAAHRGPGRTLRPSSCGCPSSGGFLSPSFDKSPYSRLVQFHPHDIRIRFRRHRGPQLALRHQEVRSNAEDLKGDVGRPRAGACPGPVLLSASSPGSSLLSMTPRSAKGSPRRPGASASRSTAPISSSSPARRIRRQRPRALHRPERRGPRVSPTRA